MFFVQLRIAPQNPKTPCSNQILTLIFMLGFTLGPFAA